MKKSLIAGAGVAALAMAALPFAGVFADSTPVLSVKDKLTLTVSSSCTYTNIAPEAATSSDGNPYAASAAPNQLVSFTASSAATSLKVQCNTAGGYDITPSFTGLTGPTTIPYDGTADPTAGSETWAAYYSKNSSAATRFTTSAVHGNPTMTDTWTFSYQVGTGTDQAAGTYNGTATYALTGVAGS